MADTIFVLNEQGTLIPMQPTDYDAEPVLQRLLAEHPELLPLSAGEGLARWLLVAREAGIPDDSGGDRFALDHLFLDAEGVPTLVEVKRSSDSRIRREVVGQMLDYASHFVIHWTVERVRSTYEVTCAGLGVDAAERLAALIGEDADAETFWQRVKTNLLAKRIRLLFVADRIPPELRRVVEFLNAVTDPVEVLAVEVPQYTGQGLQTFVPRVLGQTVAAQEKKGTSEGPKRKWDEASFMEALAARAGATEVDVAKRLLAWALDRGLRIWWGEGERSGSFSPIVDTAAQWHGPFVVWTYGQVEIQFQAMRSRQPFGPEERRQMLLDRLNVVPGIAIPRDAIQRRPSMRLSVLANPNALAQFLAVWDWWVDEVKKSDTGA